MTLPPDYPNAERKLSFEWLEGSRAARIHETLRAQMPHDLAPSMALQTDTLSIPARRIIACLDDIEAGGEAAVAAEMLRSWDCRLTRESAAAALFEVWWMLHLRPALLDRVTGDPVVRKLLTPGDPESLLAIIERRADTALLRETLAAAWHHCATLLGPDAAAWQWGALHHALFAHPLGPVARDAVRDVGPLAKAGSGSTVMAATYRTTDFRITAGSSFRMVADVGAWDNSRAINAPGQSGDPASPHYDDLAPLWAEGAYVPLLFSEAAVDEAAELRIRLVPGRPAAGGMA